MPFAPTFNSMAFTEGETITAEQGRASGCLLCSVCCCHLTVPVNTKHLCSLSSGPVTAVPMSWGRRGHAAWRWTSGLECRCTQFLRATEIPEGPNTLAALTYHRNQRSLMLFPGETCRRASLPAGGHFSVQEGTLGGGQLMRLFFCFHLCPQLCAGNDPLA